MVMGLVARDARDVVFGHMAALRPRHELFVREVIRTGGNGAEAYRRAAKVYPVKPLTNPNCARVIACRILKYPEVQARYQELQAQMAKRADITEDKILSDYQWAIESAKQQDKPNEVTMAATAQAKLVGLLRDRVETGEVGDFNDMSTLEEVLEGVSDLVSPEAAAELARAFGITQAAKRTETAPIEDTGHPETGLAIAKPASDAVN